ncbi:MAG: hypothetical protein QF858_02300 [Candidatus Pacebacteria bacterium]|jgi:hypothetical protein|nr:hypothetical protein [Candidatus Paceibacterota bacterium]|tara:strand:- start:1579 stop:1851 length:273 start_codon:yes stop_codon:yes gene_type:complete
MRGFRNNAVLGRCTFCKYTVREGEDRFAGKYAKITYGRWICGNCLIGMSDSVTNALKGYEDGAAERAKVLKEAGYEMDKETGKLQKVKSK